MHIIVLGRCDSYHIDKDGVILMELLSTQSMRTSLIFIHSGDGGLDAHRQSMLNRAPNPGDWARFSSDHLTMKDLAYLTAKTGHEFAILRGKNEDILFHGEACRCSFDDILAEKLYNKRLFIYGHSHPGEETPIPSRQDRETLKKIGQSESKLISGRSGVEITFTTDFFDDIF